MQTSENFNFSFLSVILVHFLRKSVLLNATYVEIIIILKNGQRDRLSDMPFEEKRSEEKQRDIAIYVS